MRCKQESTYTYAQKRMNKQFYTHEYTGGVLVKVPSVINLIFLSVRNVANWYSTWGEIK